MSLPLADTNFAEATWIMIVKSIVIFLVVFMIVPVLTVVERKLLGRFQHRYGPNRVGPVGLLQPLADVLKLRRQAGLPPDAAVPFLFALGPALVIFSGITTLAILPFGDVQDGVGLYGIDVPIGVLYFFAFGSLAFYGLLLGGWASGSKYSFLGAMRSAAQLISYEVAMGLSLLGVDHDGRLALAGRDRRGPGRGLVRDPAVRRLPDLHGRRLRGDQPRRRSTSPRPTPSSSRATTPSTAAMRFGSFLMAEYLEMFVVSGIAAAFFLGGWHGPGPGLARPDLDARQDPRA